MSCFQRFDTLHSATICPLSNISDVAAFRMFELAISRSDHGPTPTLWGFRKRAKKRGERNAMQELDNAVPAVKVGNPGSPERLAALERFYASEMLKEEEQRTSAFHAE